jgi:RND family efflux transporter MFP subunit
MKRTLILLVALVLAFAAGSWVTWRVTSHADPPRAAKQVLRYACPMHPAYHSDHPGDCPSCGMRLEPVYADGTDAAAPADAARLLRITAERQQTIGVKLGVAERTSRQQIVRTVGRVAADETRVYRITAATNGWIEKALPNTVGSLVRKDETLATYYAREFLSAQQALFYALDARDRFLAQKAGDAQMASTNVQIQQAADSLRSLGMTSSQIAELEKTRERTYQIAVRAPAAGFILERNITEGQRFDSGFEMYVIADLRRVWVLADLFEGDRLTVKPGAGVPVVYRGETVQARVSDVLPQFDAAARTLRVRLELDNPTYVFRPGMFVDVDFPMNLPPAVTVPADAVLDSGLRKIAFVDRGNGYFEPRTVETGWQVGDRLEIVKGLMPGERVVVSGNFLLDSESRMKAAAVAATAAGAAAGKIDPVCGMEVDPVTATKAGRIVTHEGHTHYFCSDDCKRQFAQNPQKFARR